MFEDNWQDMFDESKIICEKGFEIGLFDKSK